MRINKEGYKIICISGAVCVFIFWLIYHLLVSDSNISLLWVSAVLLLLFWFFIVAFFREPRRVREQLADGDVPLILRGIHKSAQLVPQAQAAAFQRAQGQHAHHQRFS